MAVARGIFPQPFQWLQGPRCSQTRTASGAHCTLPYACLSIVHTTFHTKFIYLMYVYVSPPKKIIAP